MNQQTQNPANESVDPLSPVSPVESVPSTGTGNPGNDNGSNGGNGAPTRDGDDSWGAWFVENNPLYLLSVLLMFLGLHLVSREAGAEGGSVSTVLAFFGVQNLYEIIMVGMSL